MNVLIMLRNRYTGTLYRPMQGVLESFVDADRQREMRPSSLLDKSYFRSYESRGNHGNRCTVFLSSTIDSTLWKSYFFIFFFDVFRVTVSGQLAAHFDYPPPLTQVIP